MQEVAQAGTWNAERKEAELDRLIEERAREMADPICKQAEAREAAAKELQEKLHQKVLEEAIVHAGATIKKLEMREKEYSPYLFVLLFYSILVTWFSALSSAECRETWHMFLESAGSLFLFMWNVVTGIAEWIAQVAQYVPDVKCAIAVRWLIIIGVTGALLIGATIGIQKPGKQFIKFYRHHMADRFSAIVYLSAAAGCVFFADAIQSTFAINAFWFAIIASVMYILLRGLWIRRNLKLNMQP